MMIFNCQVNLKDLPTSERTDLAVALMRNYVGVEALVIGDDLTMSSDGHGEAFLEAALLAELANVRSQGQAKTFRTALYDYLLG